MYPRADITEFICLTPSTTLYPPTHHVLHLPSPQLLSVFGWIFSEMLILPSLTPMPSWVHPQMVLRWNCRPCMLVSTSINYQRTQLMAKNKWETVSYEHIEQELRSVPCMKPIPGTTCSPALSDIPWRLLRYATGESQSIPGSTRSEQHLIFRPLSWAASQLTVNLQEGSQTLPHKILWDIWASPIREGLKPKVNWGTLLATGNNLLSSQTQNHLAAVSGHWSLELILRSDQMATAGYLL